jgi:hypothetical protein
MFQVYQDLRIDVMGGALHTHNINALLSVILIMEFKAERVVF